MRMLLRPALLMAILGTLSCGSSSSTPSTPSTPTPQASTTQVLVPATDGYSPNGSSFQPGNVTIKVGSSVTWVNQDVVEHAPTADDGSWAGDLPVRGSFTQSFKTAGTFAYHCSIHPMMTGTIVVQ